MKKTTFTDYIELLQMNYDDAVEKLTEKYGKVKTDYFNEKSYSNFLAGHNKHPKVHLEKDEEKKGLYRHHVKEDEHSNLGYEVTIKNENYPFELQKSCNLVYCDLVEHIILHLLIMKKTKNHLGELGFDSIRGKFKKWMIDGDVPEEKDEKKDIERKFYERIKDNLKAEEAIELNNYFEKHSIQYPK